GLVVSSAVIRSGDMIFLKVKEIMDGTFAPGKFVYGLKEGVLQVGPYGELVPPEVRTKIDAMAAHRRCRRTAALWRQPVATPRKVSASQINSQRPTPNPQTFPMNWELGDRALGIVVGSSP
ncbi:MAG TPA: hypothetical protein VFB99_02600, partial [Vicinamibacterales bacterium]|nr:hypothetical protein [Vicinamibacterales bacterium]